MRSYFYFDYFYQLSNVYVQLKLVIAGDNDSSSGHGNDSHTASDHVDSTTIVMELSIDQFNHLFSQVEAARAYLDDTAA